MFITGSMFPWRLNRKAAALRARQNPPPAPTFTYDRKALTALITRHYALLISTGHIHPSALREPPEPSGWSDADLNVPALRLLGRSETVIDLLRHIPYPQSSDDDDSDDAVVCYCTMVQSYLRADWRPEETFREVPDWHAKPFCDLGLAPFDGAMAPHLIQLTREEAEIGTSWVIDTERGCIYPHGGAYLSYGDEPPEAAEEKPWLRARAVSFAEYFDRLYEDVKTLKLVPVPAAGNFGHAICEGRDPEAKAIKKLYREYGWPGAFRKEEFLVAAVELRRTILDDTYDWSDAE
ncbi:hypothetical protein CkaCkLH20_06577 [Colletotrichum karsti]|uniref:Uncharacterized protein n=1 Tax=Colletotrichum karsti TaxID=1095194 RepID=A0A9P6I6T4_9PEZI|nr:uncharacterized protein CkaCkLH20_06577 [Colletotrichum karsti]KAF9876131.1 hypothetical protein CkaCkLH20_06577 [Colletotrichum karsti]